MNNNSRKVISAALAILMSTAVLPANTLVGNSSVVEARNVDLTPEQQQAALINQLKNNINKATAGFNAQADMINEQKSELANFSKIVEKQKKEISDNVAKFFMGDRTEADVENSKKNAQNGMKQILESSLKATLSKLEFSKTKLIGGKSEASSIKSQIDAVIDGKIPENQKDYIKNVIDYKNFENAYNNLTKTIDETVGTINAVEEGVKKSDLAEYTAKTIEETAQKRKESLKNSANLSAAEKKEVQDIIDKIKDADSFDKLDDISIPNKLMFNSDIIKAKSDRRQEITDGIDNRYSDYSTEEKLDVRSIEIREDKDNRGKWIVEGKVHDHIRKDVSVYYDGRYVGGGVTDGEGYFEITVNERVYDNSSLKFYAGNRKDFDRDDVKISPWDLKVSTYYVEGKYNKDTNIKVYYRGRYVGEGRTDKDGKFRIKCDEQIFNKGDLTFYKTDGSNDSAGISIISANAGDTKVTGRSSDFAEIVIKDKDNVRLGNVKADKDGNFTVFLNRALVSGEVLSITVTDKDRDEINTEYTVGAVQGNGSYKMAYAKGYPNGYFKAGANISRAEAVTMLARLMNGSDVFNTPKTTKFEDAEDGWYAQTINYVVDRGIMKGYPDGDFEPDAYITRAEFATMVSRYVKKSNPAGSDLKDIRNHWAKEAIETLYGNKIIQGYPDGTFKPEENITRAEAVTVLNAAFGRKSNLRSMDNISNPEMLITFNDVRKSDWYYAQVLDAANSHESYMNGDYEVWTIVK